MSVHAVRAKLKGMLGKESTIQFNRSILLLVPLFLITACLNLLLSTVNAFPLLAVKLSMGLIALILVPGICIACLVGEKEFRSLGFIFIFGFLYQLLNVFISWWLFRFFVGLNFVNILYLLTSTFVLIITLGGYKREWKIHSFKIDFSVATVVVIFLLFVFYYQTFSIAPHSDGANYLDLARNIVAHNSFGAKELMPPNTWANLEWSSGLIRYFFGYAGFALFFALGDVSFSMAQLTLIFIGSLCIFVVFKISEKLFNRSTAIIAAFLMALSPILLTHSVLVGGPDITSTLFVLVTIFLLLDVRETETPRLKLVMLAGFTTFAAWFAWNTSIYPLMLSIPFVLLSFRHEFTDMIVDARLHKKVFLISALVIGCVLLDLRFIGSMSYAYFGIPLPIASIALGLVLVFLRRDGRLQWHYLILPATAFLIFSAGWYTYLSLSSFKSFFASTYASSQGFADATVSATQNLVTQPWNLNLILNSLNRYFYGGPYGWMGLFNSIGLIIWFLALASLVRFGKIRETVTIFVFPLFYMLSWVLLSGSTPVQPRYLLLAAPFYFMLSASTIYLIASEVNIGIPAFKLAKWGKAIKLKRNVVVSFGIVVIILFSSVQLYENGIENLAMWNYPDAYGWNDAISWIGQNTKPDDILVARQGSYWAWLTDRQTVSLSSGLYGPLNRTDLIYWIRQFNANYLIVDSPFKASFPTLAILPAALYGSNIVFQSGITESTRILIYNVTNISHGTFTEDTMLVTNCDSADYWAPATGYGNGNFTLDASIKKEGEYAVKLEYTVNEKGTLSFLFVPKNSLNFTKASCLNFWIKIAMGENESINDVEVKFASTDINYVTTVQKNISANIWNHINLPIGVSIKYGFVDLSHIGFLQFYAHGLTPQKTCALWLDEIYTTNPSYVLNP